MTIKIGLPSGTPSRDRARVNALFGSCDTNLGACDDFLTASFGHYFSGSGTKLRGVPVSDAGIVGASQARTLAARHALAAAHVNLSLQ